MTFHSNPHIIQLDEHADRVPRWLAANWLKRTFGDGELPADCECFWAVGLPSVPEGGGWYLLAGSSGLFGVRIVTEGEAA